MDRHTLTHTRGTCWRKEPSETFAETSGFKMGVHNPRTRDDGVEL
jgi:hypothetical protein